MKKAILTITFIHLLGLAYLQAQDLLAFNQQRLEKQRVSMMVLGGWAASNIVLGGVLASQRTGEDRYFHLMNAGWNAVNLGLAAAGYYSAVNTDPGALDLYGSMQAHYNTQKIFLFNAGLDVGYMAGGLYLMERAKNTTDRPERLRGFGKSIVLQGGFLFVFDLAAYWVQARGNKDLAPLLQGFSFDGQSIGWMLHF